MIGDITPAEWTVEVDAATGRTVQRLTDGRSNSYALYYFVPSVTPDGRYLVLHSERSGAVQLYRLDLSTGEIGQLTDGHTKDAGWAVWCGCRSLAGVVKGRGIVSGQSRPAPIRYCRGGVAPIRCSTK